MNKPEYTIYIKWWEHVILFFLPMHILIDEGVVFYYKTWRDKIYFLKILYPKPKIEVMVFKSNGVHRVKPELVN